MAAKKFDLGAYSSDTSKTQTKHKKYSAFIENETEDAPAPEKAEEAKKAIADNADTSDNIVSAKPVSDETTSEDGASKRINMAFTDENYALIAGESERLAVSLVHFISSVIGMTDEKDIDSYISAMTIPRTKDFVARRRGNPAKRINLKFSPQLHSRLSRGAEAHNMTITQYLNTVIEVYAQNKHKINT